MDSYIGLLIHHGLLLLGCFLIMANRYLNSRGKHIASILLNLFVTVIIVNLSLRYGIVSALISIVLYLMYMIIMNKVVINIAGKMDKSDNLMDELKKKINNDES